MKYRLTEDWLESLKCPRCGGDRVIPFFTKWALVWQVWQGKRKGMSDSQLTAWATRLLNAMCNG